MENLYWKGDSSIVGICKNGGPVPVSICFSVISECYKQIKTHERESLLVSPSLLSSEYRIRFLDFICEAVGVTERWHQPNTLVHLAYVIYCVAARARPDPHMYCATLLYVTVYHSLRSSPISLESSV